MKKFISAITAMMFLAVTITPLTSCGDDDDPTPDPVPTPETVKPKITISQGEITETTITVTFNPDENTAKYKYAIGSASDEAAFTAGTLTGIAEVEGKESKTVPFENLEENTVYTIYAQAESSDGTKSDIVKATLTTKEVGEEPQPSAAEVTIEITNYNHSFVEFTVTPNDACSTYAVYVMDTEDQEDFLNSFGSLEEGMRWLVENEYANIYESERSLITPLYYAPTYDENVVIAVIPYDKDGNEGTFTTKEFVTPSHDPNAAPSVILTVLGFVDDKIYLLYTLDQNTTGFRTVTYGGYVSNTNTDQAIINDILYDKNPELITRTNVQGSVGGFSAGDQGETCVIPYQNSTIGSLVKMQFVFPNLAGAKSMYTKENVTKVVTQSSPLSTKKAENKEVNFKVQQISIK